MRLSGKPAASPFPEKNLLSYLSILEKLGITGHPAIDLAAELFVSQQMPDLHDDVVDILHYFKDRAFYRRSFFAPASQVQGILSSHSLSLCFDFVGTPDQMAESSQGWLEGALAPLTGTGKG